MTGCKEPPATIWAVVDVNGHVIDVYDSPHSAGLETLWPPSRRGCVVRGYRQMPDAKGADTEDSPSPQADSDEPEGCWYRFYANCGAGHQSSWEVFRWLSGEWSDDMLNEVWHECIPRWAVHLDSNIGGCEIVDKLPPKIREKMIEDYEGRLRDAQRMLKILKT